MATKKRTKKSDTELMNDALRQKAGVKSDTADIEAAYIEGLEALDEFMDEILADAEKKKAAALEAAEASIDQFIAKRSREREEANRLEASWAESTRRHNAQRREANLQQWIDFHGHQHHVFLELAAEHADRRSRLMLEAGYEPGEGAA